MAHDDDSRRLLAVAAAIFLTLLILAATAVSLRAQPPPTTPDPNFVPALWVVKWDRALKLAASNGAALIEITDPQAAAGRYRRSPRGLVVILAEHPARLRVRGSVSIQRAGPSAETGRRGRG
ncbi:MAG: hypothetical protein ACR2M4_07755 [Actinomycetota bacterium]